MAPAVSRREKIPAAGAACVAQIQKKLRLSFGELPCGWRRRGFRLLSDFVNTRRYTDCRNLLLSRRAPNTASRRGHTSSLNEVAEMLLYANVSAAVTQTAFLRGDCLTLRRMLHARVTGWRKRRSYRVKQPDSRTRAVALRHSGSVATSWR